ncbi:MAG: flagellar FliJ family protein [Desulfobulbaceae bacterium]|nr:flagellar FliJ family protein [Desulfobulbaceae bacterium]
MTFRRNLEEQAHLKLVREQDILIGHKKRLEVLKSERVRIIQDLEERKKKRLQAALFSLYMNSIRSRERDIQVQMTMIESQKHVVEEARKALLEKVKERQIIEKAKERDHQNFLKEVLKEELKEHDEMAVLTFGSERV